MTDNYILDYWNWMDNLSPDVREVVINCWDETGRPTKETVEAISMLLDRSNTFDEFCEKYFEMLDIAEDFHDDERRKVREYYHLYISGMKRIERQMREESIMQS